MFNTIDIVPDSIKNDPQVIAACGAIDIELAEIYTSIPDISFWSNVENQTGVMLDLLGWEMHVDVWQGWSGNLTDTQKIALINKSINWHQHKGTKYAVEQLLELVFVKGYVIEWYQYGGNPFFFQVVLEEAITDPTQLALVTSGINAVKNERSWLEKFTISKQSKLQMYLGAEVIKRVDKFIPVSTNSRSIL